MSDSVAAQSGGSIVATPVNTPEGVNKPISLDLSKAAPEAALEQTQEIQKVEEAKPVDKFAAKFAALSRQEKAVRDQMNSIKAQQAEIASAKAEIERLKNESSASSTDFMAKLKQNPFELLEQAGLSLEDLAQMTLNDGKVTPEKLIKQTRDELDAKYQKELDSLRASIREKEEKEEKSKYSQAEAQFRNEITELVKSNPDTYELIAANDAQGTVFEVIEQHYNETGRILSVEEAAEATESFLEEEAKKILALKKFQTSKKVEPVQEIKVAAPTLSNTLSTEVPSTGNKLLTREESIRQAAKLLRFDK